MNFVDWAQEELKLAYELEPDDAEFAYNYAFSLFKGGNYDIADEYFKKAIELESKPTTALNPDKNKLAIIPIILVLTITKARFSIKTSIN